MQTVQEISLKSLEINLHEIIEHVTLLSDYWLLTPMEIKINNSAFQWYHKLPKIIEEHRQIIAEKMQQFQQILKNSYQRFDEELESYAKQVEEIQHWGDIDEVFRYQKKAQNLENKLIAAMEKIEKFNEEEKSFDWEITQYPLRKNIADRLVPFKKLYDSTCEFLLKYEKWTGTTIGTFNPEDIDNDVNIAYRTIFKLEKALNEPVVKNLAAIVREKIEQFKNRMPAIMTLGNPGMKTRHWEEVSAIVGFPIKIDPELTLGKILNMELDDFIDKFESIAEAATKESSLERGLDKMKKDWDSMIFTVNPYKDTGTFVISGVDEIQVMSDDHITKTVTMKNSPYIKPFEMEIR